MKTPILGSSYVARSVNAADNRMVNLFPEITPDGGKEPAYLMRAPGLRYITTIGSGPIRGLWVMKEYAFVVSGPELYRVDSNWSYTYLGAVSGSGPVSMSDNGVQLFVACNPDGYIYNITTNVFSKITDPDFAGAVTVGFLDGYFVFNQPDSQTFWVTALLDGTSVDPLDFASAEGSPDNLVSLIVDHREIWLFGTNTVEVWYNAGLTDFPLARIQGAFNEIGCAAAYSVAKLDNGLFWLGADARGKGIVYRSEGYSGKRVSTHAVEWHIQQYENIEDAVGYSYQQDGHSFYVLSFPTAGITWVYDVATDAWHERGEWVNGRYDRQRGDCQMAFDGQIIIGDHENGDIYAFDLDKYDDNGVTQRWLRSWRALPMGQNNLNRTTQHSLQLDCETGVGISTSGDYESERITTEDNDSLITEFNQIYYTAENGNLLTTETGSPLVAMNLPQPYPSGGAYIVTNPYLAIPEYNPQVMLRWSDDGGHTWSNEHWTSMGKVGQYQYRAFWRRLGMTQKLRDRVYEISGSAAVKVNIMGAELHISGTNA